MNRKIFFYSAVILLGHSAFALAQKEVASRWHNAEIKVDGTDNEWSEAIAYLEKEKVGFGLKNDSSDLYLCLKLERDMHRQALRFGLTIWFDPAGKNKKTFGVRFPIGMRNYAGNNPRLFAEDEDGQPLQVAAMLREVEVLGPEKDDRNRFTAGSSFGIQAATSEVADEHVYELKIPLQSAAGRPYAIAALAGQTVSVGFEMGEPDRAQMRERMGREGSGFGGRPGGGGPPGSSRPGGGRPPGGFGGGRPPGAAPWASGFKVWRRVALASSALAAEPVLDDLDTTRISLVVQETSLREALQKLSSQSKLQIVYSDALVKDVKVSCTCRYFTVRAALHELLEATALTYEITSDAQIVIVKRGFKR